MPFVKDVTKNWREMDGDNDLEKKINSYLTARIISNFDMPSDECISYAKTFSKLTNLTIEEKQIINSTLQEAFDGFEPPRDYTETAEMIQGIIRKELKRREIKSKLKRL